MDSFDRKISITVNRVLLEHVGVLEKELARLTDENNGTLPTNAYVIEFLLASYRDLVANFIDLMAEELKQ